VMERVQMCEKEMCRNSGDRMSGRCNHAEGETNTHTHKWAETTKHVQKVTEDGLM
jgi:hypothetical protein